MDDLVFRAARYAREAHAGQTRKYHGRPFIEHPARVAARVMLLDNMGALEVAAAWMHDIFEDCGRSEADLDEAGFPPRVGELVRELSNPSKRLAHLSRRERTRMDHDHLAGCSRQAQRIKLIDRIDNLQDLSWAKSGFKSVFVAESLELAVLLEPADPDLAEELRQVVEQLGFPRDHQHRRRE